ncbi:hypothetical protein HNR25_005038 [Streptomonospora salina]|uniref:Uncharacterized protein n=1 Tax=Streptomonospora salina TaxID=104205 RepID=A0A841EIJ9_9ACTN|nr:hypothetical protein [Streptomonospora salina]
MASAPRAKTRGFLRRPDVARTDPQGRRRRMPRGRRCAPSCAHTLRRRPPCAAPRNDPAAPRPPSPAAYRGRGRRGGSIIAVARPYSLQQADPARRPAPAAVPSASERPARQHPLAAERDRPPQRVLPPEGGAHPPGARPAVTSTGRHPREVTPLAPLHTGQQTRQAVPPQRPAPDPGRADTPGNRDEREPGAPRPPVRNTCERRPRRFSRRGAAPDRPPVREQHREVHPDVFVRDRHHGFPRLRMPRTEAFSGIAAGGGGRSRLHEPARRQHHRKGGSGVLPGLTTGVSAAEP